MSSTDTPLTAIPHGWTNEPSHMYLDYYWSGEDDLKSELEQDYGLVDVHPLITRTHDSGDLYFIFQSSSMSAGGYYVWNGLSSEVYQIVEPTNLEGIYRRIDARNGALGGLEMVRVYAREVDDPEEEGEDEEGNGIQEPEELEAEGVE